MFPYSPLRGYVLGMKEARHRTAVTDAEMNQMKQLFYEGMKAGAFGFSLDKNREDRAEDGSLLPSHAAADEEFVGLAEVLGEFGVGHIGLTMGFGMTDDERRGVRDLMTNMMRVSGRPLGVTALQGDDDLAWVNESRDQGFPVVNALVAVPLGIEFKMSEFNLYDYMPNWVEPMVGTAEERMAKLMNPATREAMKVDVDTVGRAAVGAEGRTDYNNVKVLAGC